MNIIVVYLCVQTFYSINIINLYILLVPSDGCDTVVCNFSSITFTMDKERHRCTVLREGQLQKELFLSVILHTQEVSYMGTGVIQQFRI